VDPRPAVRKLRLIKLAHTAAWAFFVACIVGVPFAAWAGRFELALLCGVAVLVEVGILLVNSWSCPLTAVAARYTDDRRANFDIYLPEVIARHNKGIFGTLYIVGVVFALVLWMQRTP
jgi:hypothetical protein